MTPVFEPQAQGALVTNDEGKTPGCFDKGHRPFHIPLQSAFAILGVSLLSGQPCQANAGFEGDMQNGTTKLARAAPPPVAFPAGPLLAALFLFWPAAALVVLCIRSLRAALRRSAVAARAAIASAGILAGITLPAAPAQAALPLVGSVAVLPFSLPALAWGLANGGEVSLSRGLVAVTGMESGYGSRGLITIGQVVLTGKEQAELDNALLRHELRHTTHWAYLGGAFPIVYYLSEYAGGGPEGNVFEINADLEDGNYGLDTTNRG